MAFGEGGLHGDRRMYPTMPMVASVNPKPLSHRICHVNEPVTVQIYTHRSAVEAAGRAEGTSWVVLATHGTPSTPGKGPQAIRLKAFDQEFVVAGTGFEPVTSGL